MNSLLSEWTVLNIVLTVDKDWYHDLTWNSKTNQRTFWMLPLFCIKQVFHSFTSLQANMLLSFQEMYSCIYDNKDVIQKIHANYKLENRSNTKVGVD